MEKTKTERIEDIAELLSVPDTHYSLREMEMRAVTISGAIDDELSDMMIDIMKMTVASLKEEDDDVQP